jgi:hypothetical protein
MVLNLGAHANCPCVQFDVVAQASALNRNINSDVLTYVYFFQRSVDALKFDKFRHNLIIVFRSHAHNEVKQAIYQNIFLCVCFHSFFFVVCFSCPWGFIGSVLQIFKQRAAMAEVGRQRAEGLRQTTNDKLADNQNGGHKSNNCLRNSEDCCPFQHTRGCTKMMTSCYSTRRVDSISRQLRAPVTVLCPILRACTGGSPSM